MIFGTKAFRIVYPSFSIFISCFVGWKADPRTSKEDWYLVRRLWVDISVSRSWPPLVSFPHQPTGEAPLLQLFLSAEEHGKKAEGAAAHSQVLPEGRGIDSSGNQEQDRELSTRQTTCLSLAGCAQGPRPLLPNSCRVRTAAREGSQADARRQL